MKRIAILGAVALVSASAGAQELGRVISSTPVFQQVQIPRQVCGNEQISVQPAKSGAGAAVGAIAGGALGNASANGRGRGAATVMGAVVGAVVGGALESSPEPRSEVITRCATQMTTENRAVGYDVVYEFGGNQYSARLPNDPGPTIAVQVAPVGSAVPNAPVVTSAPPVYVQTAPVVSSTYVTQSVVPVYYERPIYRPVYAPLTFQWGGPHWGGGWEHGRHFEGHRGH
jgi:uncharacterized protein YcfJ